MKNSTTLLSDMQYKLSSITRVFIAIFIVGILFKIMHWPYSGPLIVLSLTGVMVSSIIKFVDLEQKTAYQVARLTLIVLFCLRALFGLMHWPYSGIVVVLFWISLLVFLAFEAGRLRSRRDSGDHSGLLPSSWLWMSAAALTTIGFLFKIAHWPYANIILTVGMLCGAFWFLKDLFKK